MSNPEQIQIGMHSDVGKVRGLNEDALGAPQTFNIDPELEKRHGTLVAVADGMGGHAAGEIASRQAIEALFEAFYATDIKDPQKALSAAFAEANLRVHEVAAVDPAKKNMGTTLVAAVIKGSSLAVANVGDSRVYLIRGSDIRQITEDHSWVAEQVRAQMLTQDQADSHIYKNVITRAIGSNSDAEADLFEVQLKSQDALVLCTDGLSNKVNPAEIHDLVACASDPEDAARNLIRLANDRGGDDNATVVVVFLNQVPDGWLRFFRRTG